MSENGTLQRNGRYVLMVTRDSATTLSWEPSNQIPLEGDHSTLVKFSHPTQDSYKTVASRLKEALTETTKAAELPG